MSVPSGDILLILKALKLEKTDLWIWPYSFHTIFFLYNFPQLTPCTLSAHCSFFCCLLLIRENSFDVTSTSGTRVCSWLCSQTDPLQRTSSDHHATSTQHYQYEFLPRILPHISPEPGAVYSRPFPYRSPTSVVGTHRARCDQITGKWVGHQLKPAQTRGLRI